MGAELLLWITRATVMRKNLSRSSLLDADLLPSSSASGDMVVSAREEAPAAAAVATASTWQEHLCAHVVAFLSTTPETILSPIVRALQVVVASKMHILTSEEEGRVLSASAPRHAHAALFWKQKLWGRLFPRLAPVPPVKAAAAHASASLPALAVLAVCALLRGVPQSILQEDLGRVVEIVVTGLRFELETPSPSSSSSCSCSSASESTAAGSELRSALSVQVMAALQQLLALDAELFVSFLNVVVPAVLQVSELFLPPAFFALPESLGH